ncbi:hypothetical protein MMC13_006972 [Lambiella insularis]|nr:hypothetical protein [Lambiella insularis]
MPGTKSIMWNDSNDSKMLRALLTYGDIQVNHAVAKQIAAYMGPGVTDKAIKSHVTLSKQKFRKENPGSAPSPANRKKKNDSPPDIAEAASEKNQVNGDSGDSQNIATDSATPTKKRKLVDEKTPDTKPKSFTTPTATGNAAHHGIRADSEVSATPTLRAKSEVSATSKRCSPRDLAKPDYHRMNDPFVCMKGAIGEDGGNIFGATADYSSEDSYDTDENFVSRDEEMEPGLDV